LRDRLPCRRLSPCRATYVPTSWRDRGPRQQSAGRASMPTCAGTAACPLPGAHRGRPDAVIAGRDDSSSRHLPRDGNSERLRFRDLVSEPTPRLSPAVSRIGQLRDCDAQRLPRHRCRADTPACGHGRRRLTSSCRSYPGRHACGAGKPLVSRGSAGSTRHDGAQPRSSFRGSAVRECQWSRRRSSRVTGAVRRPR
jgi:hypothetical protein